MADFAEIRSDNNEVLRVVRISDDDVAAHGGDLSTEAETWVADFIAQDPKILSTLGTYPETYWKQTFKDGSQRRNMAMVDHKYYPEHDGFEPPRPGYPGPNENYTFNTTTWRWEEIE